MKFTTIRFYYLATPVFFILHQYFGINLRVSIPTGQDAWLYLYYIICFAASFIVFKSVIAGALFTIIESSVNILLLILSVWLPIINMGTGNMEQGMQFGVQEIIHFLIVGTILLVGFYSNPLLTKKV